MDVKNYRPITILSCLGKVFTSVLNSRLNQFLEEYMTLCENQAGFRKQYSTTEHIFSLHALIEILKAQKKKLFCCFVDFSSAFDSVWRIGLWNKMIESGINGKIFRVIVNMYHDIKSCVSVAGEKSAFFHSLSGVRQGENLSPVLFSLYLNDLEAYLLYNTNTGLTIDCDNIDITFYLRLIVLLYADDTVILASNEADLQFSLNRFDEYCKTWKLTVNVSKTKVVIFGAKKTDTYTFKLGQQIIEIADKYKYLGVYFSQSRSFLNARKHAVEQAKKAMYLLYCRTNNLNLPIDLQLKLFDHTVLPILTYACDVWGYENLDIIERVHTEFLRKITKCRKSTPVNMLYAELGRYPLEIIVKTRIVSFWIRITQGKATKLSYFLYQALRSNDKINSKWILNINKILCDIGRNDLWIYQNQIGTYPLKFIAKQMLIDQFLQNWRSSLTTSSKGKNFNLFKDSINLERYFLILPNNLYINMVRFRTANHKLPIELGRWNNIEYDERKCDLCDQRSIGDEFHYLLECDFFKRERQLFISDTYYRRPNILKYKNLLSCQDESSLIKLGKFMGLIMKQFVNNQ